MFIPQHPSRHKPGNKLTNECELMGDSRLRNHKSRSMTLSWFLSRPWLLVNVAGADGFRGCPHVGRNSELEGKRWVANDTMASHRA